MPGTVFVNTKSGSGDDTAVEELRNALPGITITATPPEELDAAIEREIEAGANWIGVAGGDGTIRSAAEQLAGRGVALLPVPTGTLNHFSRQLGIESPADVLAAINGETVAVDVGEVNGHTFVNNSSVGLYARVVTGRERRTDRLPKRLADLAALADELRRGRTLHVRIDDLPVATWMVFVGNNEYCSGVFNIARRETVTGGVLDLRLVRADARWSRTRVLFAALVKRLDRSPLIVSRRASEVVIDPDPHSTDVALDGEVEHLTAPLRYRSRAGALLVRVPLATPAEAPGAVAAVAPA